MSAADEKRPDAPACDAPADLEETEAVVPAL